MAAFFGAGPLGLANKLFGTVHNWNGKLSEQGSDEGRDSGFGTETRETNTPMIELPDNGLLQVGPPQQPLKRQRSGLKLQTEDEVSLQKSSLKLLTKEEVSLETVMCQFRLSNGTLRRMMAKMDADMSAGLEGGLSASTVAMLPSFVPRVPDGTEKGRYLALDLGGSNLRVMLMELYGPNKPPTIDQFHSKVPYTAQTGTGEQLFDFVADCLGEFLEERGLAEKGLSLGFTFSFPCEQTSLKSAKLLRWTKSFDCEGVVGRDVVKMLQEAIDRRGGIKVNVVALVNDTVGTQVAAAYDTGSCDIGVIIATGTNAAYMERVERIPKVNPAAYPYKEVVINTEWCGFADRHEADYIVTEYDRIIDNASMHPGVQIFEKLIAGMFMGEQVRLVLEKLVRSNVLFNGAMCEALTTSMAFPTKYISEILRDESGEYSATRQIVDELGVESCSLGDVLILREVCMFVARRSANLAAAALACLMLRIGKKNITIGIDGSTYQYLPYYEYWLHDKIRELVPPDYQFKIVKTQDGSGKGAALIAAVAESLEREKSG